MHGIKRRIGRTFVTTRFGAALLLAATVLPGAAMAADGKIGTSQFYSRLAYDVNNRPYRIAEIPTSWYSGRPACAGVALNNMPYVASFVGGDGNFANTDSGNAARNGYYQGKMMAMANALPPMAAA